MDYRIIEIRQKLEYLYEKNGLTEEVLILSMKLDREINEVQKRILKKDKFNLKN